MESTVANNARRLVDAQRRIYEVEDAFLCAVCVGFIDQGTRGLQLSLAYVAHACVHGSEVGLKVASFGSQLHDTVDILVPFVKG